MINLIYNYIFIPIASFALFFLKKFNKKIALKENSLFKINSKLNQITKNKKRIWFHASSMGEFEQAKPIIELIKLKNNYEIICSFYSPSGYEHEKYYKNADFVCYMPFDSSKNARDFIELIKPDLAVFVRYDLWFNHLKTLNESNIPTFLINATKPSGKFTDSFFINDYYKKCFSFFDKIITVGIEQSNYFENLKLATEVITASDSRLDRISEIVDSARENPILPKNIFKKDFVIIAGSSWQEDEEYLASAVVKLRRNGKNIRVIYVPHEPNTKRLAEIYQIIDSRILLSELLLNLEENPSDEYHLENDVIVDSIGKLLRLYASANLALIGDGWGKGVHSVSEPAGYGIPLVSGPKIDTMPDAVNLHKLGGLKIAQTENDLYDFILLMIENKKEYDRISQINKNYVSQSKGTSKKIVEIICQ